jgi:hypothetical protein
MPFGASFIIVAFAGLLQPWIQRLSFALCISLFIAVNVSNYRDFYNDWNKQIQIIGYISSSKFAKNSNLLVFRDETKNAIRRTYRDYEWGGIINRALPGEFTRFGVSEAAVPSYKNGSLDNQLTRFHSTKNHVKLSEGYPVVVSITRINDKLIFKADSLKEY